MKEREMFLKSYRKEIDVLVLQVELSNIEDYKKVLLRLINNKRNDRSILEVNGFNGSNVIEFDVNLTDYLKSVNKTEDEVVEHLREWLIYDIDIATDKVKVEKGKAYVYEIDDMQFNYFDKDDNFIRHYVERY